MSDAGAAAISDRIDTIDWPAVTMALDDVGLASLGPVLERDECDGLIDLYDNLDRFRSTVDMASHRFGRGQYRYFNRPLPTVVARLRAAFWPHLLPIVREWADRRDRQALWPDTLDEWLDQCLAAGQSRPTPLMLRYGPGDWNALHRDLYGELVFPLQVVIGLNDPNTEYTGGEFVVVEQLPRAQSRATATSIPRGHGLVVTTSDRPIRTQSRWATAPMRHGLSVVRTGRRHALGLIFHDAQ